MNRSLIVGAVAGAGVAIAGGVAGLTLLDEPSEASRVAEQEAGPTAARERCSEQEVTRPAEPKDENRVAGTPLSCSARHAAPKAKARLHPAAHNAESGASAEEAFMRATVSLTAAANAPSGAARASAARASRSASARQPCSSRTSARLLRAAT